ncbi:hypothetical protein SDC9_201420 [bioreactor metagenome]|uniref:RecJ OB domain-containing protein n=1 Tax=bioreactor metagenome TaxID=1076179 RepID=A0A645IZT5_9ZZZZ
MAYQHYFSAFGGHKQACGFTIKTENFPAFIDDLQKENGILDQPFPSSVIAVELNDLTIENIEELDRLKPFGTGLKRPLFYLRQLPVTKVELIKNKYPKATGAINGQTVEIISFNDKKIITDQQGCLSEIIGTLSINYYLNRKKINILVEDVSYFNSD